MFRSIAHLILLASPLAYAIDFAWTYEGERFWATEVARLPKSNAIYGPCLQDGVGYISVEETGWPQFNATIQGLPLPEGAYVVSEIGDSIVAAKAYNVKDDPALAFMEGSVPAGDNSYSAFLGGVPVPPPVGNGPLGGLRSAVKDIFHVKGMKTSGGSKSYFAAYDTQNFTVETVEKSVAGGAHLVGKTRTIAFALGTPRNGWEVDYQDPWSFRGDGYQTTGGSSSGSSSAIINYDWIDFTIGSDTGGSVRFPARFGGFYGYKPTQGIYNLTGILPAISEQDTPGFMARSPTIFRKVYHVWSEDSSLAAEPTALPSKFQYWSDEELTQPEAEEMKNSFFANMSEALGMSTFSQNLTAIYARHFPNQNFTEEYNTVYADQNSVQFYDKIGKDLIETFGDKYDGAFPPTDPVVNLTFADGIDNATRARYPESQRKREQYANWFNTHILPHASREDTCTSSVVAHSLHVPPSTVKTDLTPYTLVRGFYNGMQASYAGTPEIVVPIGQVQYWSPYTQKMEWQTVTVAFMAAKGCDGTLMELVRVLEEKGLVKEVLQGKVAYPV